uniref:AAA ATPase domain-containing protein n=1 Tax=Candidatus Kentrum eta TaxID=2126337 RepID=A0A450UDA6_9GAMM|nr:MAG: AAA ATPase domain-containing protein [Candidatus Kentron sp. H]VFJ90426.1 MAG: AAA ATPase domain-containing protein [Candidatus Kentron sp. H]VFJ97073.1 MAG: AAA ATPase domain-containing protein [Candidatus Kentron sp. H]
MTNTTNNFHARLGDAANPGFLPETERLAQIRMDLNPFVTDTELPENSPVFFGRDYIMHEILSALCHPGKPRCVSLLGEGRMGKSSLLNQVFAALGKEDGLVAIRGSARGWQDYTPERFFADLHGAIEGVIGEMPQADASDTPESDPLAVTDYQAFRARLFPRAKRYRFVLILDAFETLLANPDFGAQFLAHLHHLGNTPEFRFGHLLASRRPVSELRERFQAFESSSLWNLFGLTHVLGPLQPEEGLALREEPWRRSLKMTLSPKEAERLDGQAGLHPALLQEVSEAMWRARAGRSQPDPHEIRQGLWAYFRDLWADRSQEEKGVLARILGGKPVTEHLLSRDLRSRGLIVRKGRKDALFSESFEEFIRESVAGDRDLSAIMKERVEDSAPDEKPERGGKKWLNGLFKMANKIGGLRG